MLPTLTLAVFPVPCVQSCLWPGCLRSRGRCNPNGRVCSAVTAGYVAAASISFRSRESVVEYLVVHACFVLPSSVGSGPCWLPGEGSTCPWPRAQLGMVGHSAETRAHSPPSATEAIGWLSNYFTSWYLALLFWSMEQLKCWKNSCWVDHDQALVKWVSSRLSLCCGGIGRGP